MLDVLAQDYVRTAQAKGLVVARGADRPRAEERRGADRDHHRHRHRAADRRRDRHRDRVRDARHRPAHRRCDPAPRLSDHPGRDPDLFRRSTCWSTSRSTCATCSSIRGFVTDDCHRHSTRCPSRNRPTWRRFREAFRRHPTAIVGAVVLLLMIVIAIFAPWLGTVDPQAVSPIKRLKPPSARILVRHRHAGSRRVQPRAVRRARLAHGRHRGRACRARWSVSRSDSSPDSCAGSTRS